MEDSALACLYELGRLVKNPLDFESRPDAEIREIFQRNFISLTGTEYSNVPSDAKFKSVLESLLADKKNCPLRFFVILNDVCPSLKRRNLKVGYLVISVVQQLIESDNDNAVEIFRAFMSGVDPLTVADVKRCRFSDIVAGKHPEKMFDFLMECGLVDELSEIEASDSVIANAVLAGNFEFAMHVARRLPLLVDKIDIESSGSLMAGMVCDNRFDFFKELIDLQCTSWLPRGSRFFVLEQAVVRRCDRFVEFIVDTLGDQARTTTVTNATILHLSAQFSNLATFEKLFSVNASNIDCKNQSGETPLYEALSSGHIDTANFLVDHGADYKIGSPDTCLFPVHLAAKHPKGHTLIAKIPDQRNKKTGARKLVRKYPINIAADHGNFENVRLLLKQGVSALPRKFYDRKSSDYVDDAIAPINNAAASGVCEIVELLVAHGADINYTSTDGMDVLNAAISHIPHYSTSMRMLYCLHANGFLFERSSPFLEGLPCAREVDYLQILALLIVFGCPLPATREVVDSSLHLHPFGFNLQFLVDQRLVDENRRALYNEDEIASRRYLAHFSISMVHRLVVEINRDENKNMPIVRKARGNPRRRVAPSTSPPSLPSPQHITIIDLTEDD